MIPAGFDATLRAGTRPTITVLDGDSPTVGGGYVVTSLESVLRSLAGQRPPAVVDHQAVATIGGHESAALERLGFANFLGLISVLTVLGLVGITMVPMLLAEETEKKTIDTLVVVTSCGEVVAGKVLTGISFCATLAVTMAVLTGLAPTEPLVFGIALRLAAIFLVGVGLFVGGFFRSATTVNTWSTFLLVPLLAPAIWSAILRLSRARTSLSMFSRPATR